MSRTVPTGAGPEWPHDPEGNQGQTGEQRVPGSGYGDSRGAPGPRGNGQAYNPQAYDPQGYNGQGREGRGPDGQANGRQPTGGLAYPERGGYDQQGYGTQGYGSQDRGYPGQPGQQHDAYRDPRRGGGQDYGRRGYNDQGYANQGYNGRGYNDQGYNGQGYNDQGYNGRGYNDQGYNDQGYNDQGYNDQGYNDQGYADQPTRPYDGYGDPRRDPAPGYADQPTRAYGYQGQGHPRGYPDSARGYPDPGRDYPGPAPAPAPGPGPGSGPGGAAPRHRVRFRRLRRFARRPTVRVIGALVGVFLVWVMFSAGQAAFKNNGQGVAANLAEWARDHQLGPVVTFGEWLSYNPPKTGGTPSFSLAVPKDQQVTPVQPKKHGFKPDIPATLKPLATGAPLPGEGQWRVVEKVKGQPAILATLLRDAGQHTSYVNGIASIDQRLVKFSLRPGTEDPGAANWGVPNYIPPGQRTGLLATFNGGFKLDSARGGFYLNGIYHGSLVNGTASIVYYKNGTMKIGEWGRDFRMNSQIAGVRQNLNLLVDHGRVSANANQDVIANFGATLGGGYYVWRSGLGITKDGRIVFVYGPALNAEDLGQLLQRAGAVEGMQMDINPAWMKFDYYTAGSHASDPTPAPLLQNQQPSPYSYYTPSTRDFTAVYAR